MPVNSVDYGRSSLAKWNFRKFHMSMDRGGRNAGSFLTSEQICLAAGPPRLKDLAGEDIETSVMPVGFVDNVSLNQNKMLQQIFECGSRRSYIIGGRATGSLGFSRPVFAGPNILRIAHGNGRQIGLRSPDGAEPGFLAQGGTGINGDGTVITPDENEAEFWINMQAEIFDRPIGWYIYMIDQRERPIGGFYVEEAMSQGHGMSWAAQGVSVPENLSMMFDRVVPCAIRGAAA